MRRQILMRNGNVEGESRSLLPQALLHNNVDNYGTVAGPSSINGEHNVAEVEYEQLRPTFGPCSSCNVAHAPNENNLKMVKGALNTISGSYESLDYDTCENSLFLEEELNCTYKSFIMTIICRWFIMALIGILTGLTAAIIDITVESLSIIKYSTLKKKVDESVNDSHSDLLIPLLFYQLLNFGPVLIATLLTSFVEPTALGSGISQVKCYLNGVKVPKIVRIRTMFVKVVGVVMSVVGGLAVGKEGPMIQTGAAIAAGVSQGKSTTFKKDFNIFESFRNDQEKRDFVSGGAAAGVSAAFGAPVGGVLFSLEEGASFWNQSLTWKIFFCSMISTVTLNFILSAYHGHPGELTYSGLINFGEFGAITYKVYEIPIFIIMGGIGGMLGAVFVEINNKLTAFRMRYVYHPVVKVIEACLVAIITATVGYTMIFSLNDCKTLGKDPNRYPVQLYCDDGEYNALAAIWFQTSEAGVRSFFHDPSGSHQPLSVAIFFVVYFILSCWTYGISVPSGLFIPALLTGAAWGRMVGMLMEVILPNVDWIDPGKYALVGAAAQLGGVVRMTLSLTVILIEATGNITFGLPLMVVLICSKYVADYFNEGIYDLHIKLQGVPLLAWEPPPLSNGVTAEGCMSTPVIVFNMVENVGKIVDVLFKTAHNGFPITDRSVALDDRTFGRFRGLILRSQLIVLLQQKCFVENAAERRYILDRKIFRRAYPRYPTIDQINISHQERDYTLDLAPVCNPSTFTVYNYATMPRIFRLFRALGLRHLVIINETNEVVGMVTRKDLARFRCSHRHGVYTIEELHISHG